MVNKCCLIYRNQNTETMKTIKLLICALCFLFINDLGALNARLTSTISNPCMPQVTITPIPNTYGCYSITAGNGNPNDPDSYYQWHFQDGSNGIGKTIYHCCSPVSITTNYTLSLNYNSPALCGPLPTYSVYTIVLNPPPSTLCVNNTPSVTLAANSVTVWGGIIIPEIMTNYTFGDGSPRTQINTHTYAACGNYIIQVNQWDMNMPNDTCYAFAAVNINCANPNGIKDNSSLLITKVYPNPAKEALHIRTLAPIISVKAYDLFGKEILLPFDEQGIEVNLHLEMLSSGIHFVKIEFENNAEAYIKFIKE